MIHIKHIKNIIFSTVFIRSVSDLFTIRYKLTMLEFHLLMHKTTVTQRQMTKQKHVNNRAEGKQL